METISSLKINIMRRFLITSILAAIVAVGTVMAAQDYPEEYLGLPGDNFNLYAVMKLFQESETIEGFERSLNDENSRINNLDLNNDNYIDYIKVLDYVDGNVHTIVLQAVLGRNENQDLAVFTVERFRDGSVQIQLIGDEALYGRNYIVEPIYAETPNPGYTGRSTAVVRTTYVEVAAWPLVRFIYMPTYRVWRSSWYWGYYPRYWNPWRPYYWHYYYGYHYHWFPYYYGRYHRWDYPRYSRWNDFYYRDKRVYSRNVTININSGNYRNTYSRPEQRKEGETLYARAHPDRASTMSSTRRTLEEISATRQSSGSANSTTRRSATSVSGNQGTVRSSDQSAGTVRRAPATVNENRSSNSSSGQNSGTVRRAPATVNENRSSNSSSSGQSSGTVRRTTTTVNENRATSPSRDQSTRTENRSTTTVNSRTRSSASSGSNNSTVSRPATTSTSRAGTSSSAGQSPASNRRSSGTVSSVPASRPQATQRTAPSRSSRPAAASSGSSSRKSSGSSKSAASSSKKSSSSKESESSTSRRK
jgi:hypothetical protein